MRRTELKRRTPIRSLNPDRIAKRKARKPKVPASVRRQLRNDAGDQCEWVEFVTTIPALNYELAGYNVRCPTTERLEIHHEHYKQTPENPTDGLKLYCRTHHHLVESRIRPWNVGRLGR